MSLEFVSQSFFRIASSEIPFHVAGTLADGEIVGLQGPSGCGKSTLLRHIAQVGTAPLELRLDGKLVSEIAPEQRRISLVFQKALLFPHLNVSENIRFPLRFSAPYQTWSRELQDQRIVSHLEAFGLSALAERQPSDLSGGEAMRIAILRAVVSVPRCLLLDEAFAALDKQNKALVKTWLKRFIKEHRIPTLMVAHVAEDLEDFVDRKVLWPASGQSLQF